MFTSKDEYHRRYNICKLCERFDTKWKKCLDCGCFMPLKCKISGAMCPKGLWGIVDVDAEEDNLETFGDPGLRIKFNDDKPD